MEMPDSALGETTNRDEPVISQNSDGFVKWPQTRRENPEECGVVNLRPGDEGCSAREYPNFLRSRQSYAIFDLQCPAVIGIPSMKR